MLQPALCWRLRELQQCAVDASAGRVRVHSATWAPEHEQAQLLACGAEVSVERSDGDGVRAALAARRGERVLRVVHRDCPAHGMVANVLRPRGGLLAIDPREKDFGFSCEGAESSIHYVFCAGVARRLRLEAALSRQTQLMAVVALDSVCTVDR